MSTKPRTKAYSPPWLYCVCCGCRGTAPTIRPNGKPPDHVPIVPAFGYGDPPRTVLLCEPCTLGWRRRQRQRQP